MSGFIFFGGPMTAICVLYVLIGVKLKRSRLLQTAPQRYYVVNRGISAQTRVIRMLSKYTRFNASHFVWRSFVGSGVRWSRGILPMYVRVCHRYPWTRVTWESMTLPIDNFVLGSQLGLCLQMSFHAKFYGVFFSSFFLRFYFFYSSSFSTYPVVAVQFKLEPIFNGCLYM